MSSPSSHLFRRLRGLTQAALLAVPLLIFAAPFSQALAACSSPAGNAGDIIYNDDENLLSYCDDTNWIGVRGSGKPNVTAAPSSGLIAHWKLEETTGATLYDQLGNNNGTWNDNTDDTITTESATGPDGNALDFEYSDQAFVNIDAGAGTTDLDNLGPMTVCAWVNFESMPGAGGPIVDKRGGASFGNGGWNLGYNRAGGERFFFSTNMGDGFQTNFNTVDLGENQHVCGTWDGTDGTAGVNVYLNGNLDNYSSFTDTITIDDAAYDIEICRDNASSTFCDGLVDDVRIYNRVLSSTEIGDLYQATGGNDLTLVLHHKLDETSGTTVTDSSIYGNDGTWTGSAAVVSETGKLNTALVFDGVAETVEISDAPSLDHGTDDFTFAAWVKIPPTELCNTSGGEGDAVISQVNGSRPQIYLTCHIGNQAPLFRAIDSNDDTIRAEGSTKMNDGQWHHMAGVKEGHAPATISIYVDGVLEASASGTYTGVFDYPSGTSTYIASFNNNYELEAVIDDARIYNRALSASEIGSLAAACEEGSMIYNADHHVPQYCAGNDDWVAMGPVRGGIENDLVGHWRLDETSGTTVGDSSGNLNNGSMMNGLDGSTSSVDGKIGTSLDFDHNNDHRVSISSPSAVLDDIWDGGGTVSFWTHLDSAGENQSNWVSKGTWIINNRDSAPDLGIEFDIDFSGQSNSLWRRSDGILVGEWNHIVITYNADSTDNDPTLYINGIETALTEITTPIGTRDSDAGNAIHIGDNASGTISQDGRIDDVRFYDRMLSEAEITALFELGNDETSSLVGHWKLDDLSGTTATDSSIYVNNGTLDNFPASPSWSSSGNIMGTLSFDGVDDYISVTDPGTNSVLDYDVGDEITLSAWIKSDNLTGYRNIITKRSPVNYNFQTLGTGVMFGYESGGWHDFHAGVGTLSEGQWHHIAATHTNNGDPNSISIYIDGQPIAGGSWVEGDGTATSSPSNGPLLFGTESGGAVNQFDGLMDDLRIYNRVLSATEINALYKLGIGNCTNPVGKEGDMIIGDISLTPGADYALMYCDGANWQTVGKTPQ